MTIVFLLVIDPRGNYHDLSYGGPTMEDCFDQLTKLVTLKWQLLHAQLSMSDNSLITLPVEAFDEAPMTGDLQQLCQEWEAILGNTNTDNY